ncbi:MAG: isoprenyl transferase [Coriobacteriales bacterium]|jgi:undecaprenyl diphosphate synthase
MGMSEHELLEYFGELPDDIDISEYDPERIPTHVAIIMDGNGRWAKQRGLPRSKGHEAGIEGVRAAIRTASDLGVRYLTIYSFSTENWNRPREEVEMLMELFAVTMMAEVDGLHEEGVRVELIGDMSVLPDDTREAFTSAIAKTHGNDGMTLVMAVNYGSRAEIVRAVRSLAADASAGEFAPEDIDEQMIASRLYTANIPDPDLVIRTSGEMRISNFLLWQIAYSEFYVTDILWPDFDKYELLRAVLSFQHRNRRYGKV